LDQAIAAAGCRGGKSELRRTERRITSGGSDA